MIESVPKYAPKVFFRLPLNNGYREYSDVNTLFDKAFTPSVTNALSTDLSNYKVLRGKQFTCSLMQVRRDNKCLKETRQL